MTRLYHVGSRERGETTRTNSIATRVRHAARKRPPTSLYVPSRLAQLTPTLCTQIAAEKFSNLIRNRARTKDVEKSAFQLVRRTRRQRQCYGKNLNRASAGDQPVNSQIRQVHLMQLCYHRGRFIAPLLNYQVAAVLCFLQLYLLIRLILGQCQQLDLKRPANPILVLRRSKPCTYNYGFCGQRYVCV